jgi:hypothetical protein
MIRVTEIMIKGSFHLSVWLIEQFHDMDIYDEKIKVLRLYPDGSLGKEVATCLDGHGLRLVPGFESHDLKHVLLGYKMTPVDEIRMQAFMLGNGNISPASMAIFIYGFILLPYKWPQLAADFKTGFFSQPIKTWTMEKFADKKITELRQEVVNTRQPALPLRKRFVSMVALTAIGAGLLGMLYCLPYLFSSVLEDLVGAGFPFVAGAILFASGLISLSIQSRSKQYAAVTA